MYRTLSNHSKISPITLHQNVWCALNTQLLIKCDSVEDGKKILASSEFSPFEMVVYLISTNGEKKNLKLFEIALSLLSKEDTTKTFIVPNYGEHTLLTFLCKEEYRHEKIKQKIWWLLQLGCKWDQVVQKNKTALSWLVTSDSYLELLDWCITKGGANPHHGHLLIYSSRQVLKQQHINRIKSYQDYNSRHYESEHFDASQIRICRPYKNNDIFDYLIRLGVDVNDSLYDGKITPLLAACCEGNLHKVSLLLEKGSYLYYNTNGDETIDAWFWAEQYYEFDNEINDWVYPIRNLFIEYESTKRCQWTELISEAMNQYSILQVIPIRDLLQIIVK